jgi:16S rRNA (cytosine967-C5)-methyltransferase
MTPGARLQTAIELLAEIGEGHGAADDVVGGFFRRHRFVGAKDRNAISEHIYAILRHRASIDWWIRRLNGNQQPDARLRLFATLIIVEGWEPEALARVCDGDRFRPNPLGILEQQVVKGLKGRIRKCRARSGLTIPTGSIPIGRPCSATGSMPRWRS